MKLKLTAQSIEALRLPDGKADITVWDTEISGLGLRLREGGSRMFVFYYKLGSLQRRMMLGAATPESFKTIKDKKSGEVLQIGIRERASQLLARVKLGEDVAGEKAEKRQAAAETFGVVGKLWLAKKTGKDNVRPGTYRHLERFILRYASKLHGLPLAGLSRRTVAAEIEAVAAGGHKVAANRFQATLSEFFTWAMSEGYIEQNPLIGRDTFDERPRERVLSDSELKLIWDNAGTDHFGSVIRLLALLGQRADEIASLRWSEISDDAITLPSSRTKNKREHVIPLTGPALEIINAQPRRANEDGMLRDYVFGVGERGFSGWSRCKERLDGRIAKVNGSPLPSWRVHDLRRSVASGMARLGIDLPTIEKLLNHTSGSFAGIVSVYQRHDFLPEKRRALALWGEHLLGVIEGRKSNIVQLQVAG